MADLTFEEWKDEDEVRDFAIEWGPHIVGRTISASSWTVVSGGVVVDQDSVDGTDTIVRLSGGTNGTPARIRNDITLSNGEEFQQTCKVLVKER